MNEKPILFSGEMVRAILEGRKTQTRRVVKPQPGILMEPVLKYNRGEWPCPYGAPGDVLWVRETWALICDNWPCDCETDEYHHYEYRADTNDPYPGQWPVEEAKGNPEAPKWRPSIFMPRKASRIALEITRVRAERLHQISPADVEAEGVTGGERVFDGFVTLWDSINAKRDYGWNVNPWVWVVEFKLK